MTSFEKLAEEVRALQTSLPIKWKKVQAWMGDDQGTQRLHFTALTHAAARLARFCTRRETTTEAQFTRAVKLFERASDMFQANTKAFLKEQENSQLIELDLRQCLPWSREQEAAQLLEKMETIHNVFPSTTTKYLLILSRSNSIFISLPVFLISSLLQEASQMMVELKKVALRLKLAVQV